MKLKVKIPLHIEDYRVKRRVVVTLALMILAMIYFFKDASFWYRSVSAAAFIVFFYVVDHVFDIRFKHHHYAFIVIISVASLLLSPLYFAYPQYDKVQHFFQPIFISSIVFYMVSRLRLELKWKLIFTFFIVIGILGLFEMGEYALDLVFDWKLQGVYLRDLSGLEKFNLLVEPIDDTMIDLFFGVGGTCVYGLFTIIYLRIRHRLVLKDSKK